MGLGFFCQSKVVFFIDGFNLYHALNHFAGGSDHFRYHKYKWNSLRKLANCYVTKKDSIEEILYFTTIAKWDAGKMARHKLYIRAQENEGVKVVYGKFKRKEKKCTVCQKYFWTREEKQTDVNIAVFLFQLAIEDRYEKAIIISGDTDLIPAVNGIHSSFPGKEIGVVVPIGRSSEAFKQQTDFHHKMKETHLASSRFDDTITLRDSTTLTCPPNWK